MHEQPAIATTGPSIPLRVYVELRSSDVDHPLDAGPDRGPD